MTYTELFRDVTGTVKAVVLHGLDKAGGKFGGNPRKCPKSQEAL